MTRMSLGEALRQRVIEENRILQANPDTLTKDELRWRRKQERQLEMWWNKVAPQWDEFFRKKR